MIGEKIETFLKAKNKEFEITRKLVDKDFAIRFGTIGAIVIILSLNLIIEYFSKISNVIFGGERPSLLGIFNLSYLFRYLPIYIIVLTLFSILYIKIVLDMKQSFNEIEDGQKGTAKFATREDIESQYKVIPIRDTEYEGSGGVPIARGCLNDKECKHEDCKDEVMYIDDSSVNNLVIGTTRSGKGETFVVPTIDIYSRAKDKASLIINDPKGELVAMSKETLEQRGYDVLILNLTEPLNSMSYNPLELIIQAYKNKDFGEAQLLCQTLTYSIYNDANTKDAFWQNTAMSLTNALILALCEECIPIGKEDKITLYTVANMLSELGTVEVGYDGKEKYPIDKYFNNLPITSVARMQYATTQFAKENTKGSIFVSAMNKLSMFTFEKIAKMTSKNSLDLKDIGFIKDESNKPKAIFMVTPDYDKSINIMTSIFVRQVYYVLAKQSTLSRSGSCDREVIFLLDEFGNMPPIEGMANIITVCLGRKIRFNLIIQAYNQLKTLYGDDAPTIEGNCGNQIYILTNDDDTAEKFSKLIGEKTIISHSRSGEIYSLGKSHTESLDSRRLLKSDELRKLKEGEMVIVRVIKRSDKNGNKIVPNPIFNKDKYSMKYRYKYLSDTFNNSKSFVDIKVDSLHEYVDYQKLSLFYKDEEEIKEKEAEVKAKLDNKRVEKEVEVIKKKEEIVEEANKGILTKEEKEKIVDYLYSKSINISVNEEKIIFNSKTIYDIYSNIDEEISCEIKKLLLK